MKERIGRWIDSLRLPEDVEAEDMLARDALKTSSADRKWSPITWLVAVRAWLDSKIGNTEGKLEDRIIAEWERAIGRPLSEEEIRQYSEEAMEAMVAEIQI